MAATEMAPIRSPGLISLAKAGVPVKFIEGIYHYCLLCRTSPTTCMCYNGGNPHIRASFADPIGEKSQQFKIN
jgi:hypothetical protein